MQRYYYVDNSIIKTYFVFDLDDTLYKEIDYKVSGFNYVSKKIKDLYKKDVKDFLIGRLSSKGDVWEELIENYELNPAVKESLIWWYRLHVPNIKIDASALFLIDYLRSHSAGVAILTDGRSSTQRLKIEALGLLDLPVFISDEYSGFKPSLDRFEAIQKKYKANSYVYIGDNLEKDFIAPNKLGWVSFCLRDDGRNIHKQFMNDLDCYKKPTFFVDDLQQILNFYKEP